MARMFTEMQRCAIDTRDRTLLVSAAAGSGKTATLTERIISSILDPEDPVNIDEMLIVTYTRAAVGELRERIGKAIKAAIAEDPSNERLTRQLYMLPSANISTIDSFCAAVLRANADRVGVNPGFRVADTAEAEILAESILDGLISAIYEGYEKDVADALDFDSLTDCMTDTRSEGELAAIILSLYNSTASSLFGVGSIEKLVDEYTVKEPFLIEETFLGKYAIDRLFEAVSHYKKCFSDVVSEIDDMGSEKNAALRRVLTEDIDTFTRILSSSGYNGIREVLSSLNFEDSPRSYEKSLPPITALRQTMKKDLTDRYENYFVYTPEDWKTAYLALSREFGTLIRVLWRFDELFRLEKQRRGILEYSDIERYTYECLWQCGELTDVALAQREEFKAVYIDEYQDVNSLQNKIFEAVSRDDNRFMVGDIKQSIYGFRSANAGIFASMKQNYIPIEKSSPGECASIFMSNNFRCDEGVIDFVNHIFDSIFYRLRDSIGYLEGDRLVYSKIHEEGKPPYCYPEICLAEAQDYPEDTDPKMIVPLTVANKIKNLLEDGRLDNGSRVSPGDIAIVMRNAKGREGYYKAALDSLRIPSATADDTQFFRTPEVLLTLSLLSSIDNPRRDIYLAGLMCSPLYSFTPDELAFIRTAEGDTLYDSLINYTEANPSYTHGRSFIDELEKYRVFSEGMPTDELISMLYNSTGLLALASRTGGRENLMLLYENARKFEAGSYRGLYNFISYINSVIDRKNAFDKREAPTDQNAVKIITSHSSKGLEFPIVFFVGGEESFNRSHGFAPRYVYKEEFGIGMYARTPSGLALVENPTKSIINEAIKRAKIEEEARVLYVSLTRAREKLYIVATPTKKTNEFLKSVNMKREFLSDYSVYQLSSFLDFLLAAKDFELLGVKEFLGREPIVNVSGSESPIEEIDTGAVKKSEITSDELVRRFDFLYPDKHRTQIPEKISVSRLYPDILDGTMDGALDLSGEEDYTSRVTNIRPQFVGADKSDSKKRGIATHMLLQFLDLERFAEIGASGELAVLKEKRFISERDAELVRIDEAEMFRNSQLFSDMREAKELYREFRFNVKLPAAMFSNDEDARKALEGETLLVQGVIDCLLLGSDGEYHLIDYKTDRLSDKELNNKSLAEAKMRAAHSAQLGYYAEAVKLIFGKYPKTVEVYSLPLGDTVNVMNRRENNEE